MVVQQANRCFHLLSSLYARNNPFDVGKQVNLGFYIAPFISAFNIPDEDRDDYKGIMLKYATVIGNASELSDFVLNIGVKTGFHFNGMEFFADLRHVLGKKKFPLENCEVFMPILVLYLTQMYLIFIKRFVAGMLPC